MDVCVCWGGGYRSIYPPTQRHRPSPPLSLSLPNCMHTQIQKSKSPKCPKPTPHAPVHKQELIEDLRGAVDGQLRHALREERRAVGGELVVDRLDRRLRVCGCVCFLGGGGGVSCVSCVVRISFCPHTTDRPTDATAHAFTKTKSTKQQSRERAYLPPWPPRSPWPPRGTARDTCRVPFP